MDKFIEYKNNNKFILLTVPIKNESTTTIEKLTFRIDNDKVTGHLWKFESSKGFSSQYYKLSSHEIIKNLTGKVSYTALEGTMKYKLQVINGEIIALNVLVFAMEKYLL